MENSGNSSLIRELFRSLSHSFGFNKSKQNESDTEDVIRTIGAFQFIYNKQSVTINFPSDKLEAVNKYVLESLKLHKTSRKTGAIYKNNDRSVTVTVYDTTSTIHVQGAGQMLWSEEFGKTDFVRETCDQCENSSKSSGENAAETVPKFLEESVNDDGTIPKSLEDSVGETVPKSIDESLSFREALDSLHIDVRPTVTSTPRRDLENPSFLNEDLPLQEAIAVLSNQVKILQDKLVRREQSKSLVDASTQTEPQIPEPSDVSSVILTPTNEPLPQMEPQVTDEETYETPEPTTADHSIEQPTLAENNDIPQSVVTSDIPQNAPFEQSPNKTSPQIKTQSEIANQSMDGGTTLIIGSSILQRIRTRGLQRNVRVRTMTGAQISRVRDRIEKISLDNISNIIVQAGGNDVSVNRNLAAIKNDFIEIIDDVKARSPKTRVFIAEITPRAGVDTSYANAMLRNVCQEHEATLIRTTDCIPSVNAMQFWVDGLHLSDSGTATLLKAYDQHVPIILNRTRSGQTDICHYCGESGHSTQNCRHGGKIQCYSCGSHGHKAKYCAWY